MTQFEYLSALISIVLALGMTEIMICWARLVQHRDSVQFSYLQGFWTAFILLLMVQHWWGFWRFSGVPEWTLLDLMLVFVQTASLVVAILLLIPGRVIPDEVDLVELYFANSRFFLLLGFTAIFMANVTNAVILHEPILSAKSGIRAVACGAILLLAFNSNRRLHYFMPVVFLILFGLFLAFA